MKIAAICDYVHPEAGYSINIYCKYWRRFGHEVYLLTSEMAKMPDSLTGFFGTDGIKEKDQAFYEKYGVRILRLPIITYKSGRSVYTREIFRRLKELDPDVIFVNGNDSLIGVQLTLKYTGMKAGLVMDSHMLAMASRNRLNRLFHGWYRRFVTPVILKNEIPVIRAQDDPYVEQELGIPLDKSPWISFGSDLLLFHPDAEARCRFRKEHEIAEDARVILYAGKLDPSKGGDLLARALSEKLDTTREAVFVIVGTTTGESGAETEKLFSASANRILRFPTQKYEELALFYQAADIAVYPKQCSLSFYDVQACGLPVIFEDNPVNVGRADHHNAQTYRTGSIEDLRDKIIRFVEMGDAELEEYRTSARTYIEKYYNYEDRSADFIPYLTGQARKKGRIRD